MTDSGYPSGYCAALEAAAKLMEENAAEFREAGQREVAWQLDAEARHIRELPVPSTKEVDACTTCGGRGRVSQSEGVAISDTTISGDLKHWTAEKPGPSAPCPACAPRTP